MLSLRFEDLLDILELVSSVGLREVDADLGQ